MAKAVALKEELSTGGAITAAGVPDLSFEEFAGLGTENITAEDQTIPRLKILESMSPEVNKRDGAYIQGAEVGMIMDTLTGEVVDGEAGIVFVPCYFQSILTEWRPKSAGGGFMGQYDIEDPIKNKAIRNEQGADILPNGNELIQTANFFGLLLHPTEGPLNRLLGMTKTKLKKARKWNTMIMGATARRADGSMYRLPIMANKYRLRTVPESNDKGSWFNWDISKIGTLDLSNPDEKYVLNMGVAFANAVGAGEVKAAPEHDAPATSSQHDDMPF